MMAKKNWSGLLGVAACAIALGGTPAMAQQASITLSNADAAYCYSHNNTWTLDKSLKAATVVDGVGTITWTVTATKDSSAAPTFTVHGGLTVTNSGSAPATIGNIVINLQKPNNKKIAGKLVPWVSAAANVATATNGDAATSANVVAAGSAESQPFNAAYGAGNYVVSGEKGTFTETAGSGTLEFKDASNNTVFSLVPQPVIPVGQSITLLYDATFNTSILPPAGTSLRVEALVTFGNAGARGGSGSTASNIDINGNGVLDADEAKVRTVPSRITLASLPVAPEECNDTVSVSDIYPDDVTTTGTVTTSNPVGFGAGSISTTSSSDVSVDVDSGVEGGSVCNTAYLKGSSDGGTLNVIIGYDKTDPLNPIPIYATYTCCVAADESAYDCQDIGPPSGNPDDKFCTYSKGGYQGDGEPGQLLLNNWAAIGGTLTIGIADGAGPNHDATWTDVTKLRTWIGGGGPSGALTADTLNATSTSGGTLAKQTAALALNIALNDAGSLGSGTKYGDLYYCDPTSTLNGKTVRQILAVANTALGTGALPGGYTFGTLNSLLDNLNAQAYHECEVGPFAAYLSKTPCP